MENQNIFGSRVLEQRTKLGLKQAELGAKVGLSHKAISTIESGKRGTIYFPCFYRLPPGHHGRPHVERRNFRLST